MKHVTITDRQVSVRRVFEGEPDVEIVRVTIERSALYGDANIVRAAALRAAVELAGQIDPIFYMHESGRVECVYPPSKVEKDDARCAICGWPLATRLEDGCIRGNCSRRPPPDRFYDAERAYREKCS